MITNVNNFHGFIVSTELVSELFNEKSKLTWCIKAEVWVLCSDLIRLTFWILKKVSTTFIWIVRCWGKFTQSLVHKILKCLNLQINTYQFVLCMQQVINSWKIKVLNMFGPQDNFRGYKKMQIDNFLAGLLTAHSRLIYDAAIILASKWKGVLICIWKYFKFVYESKSVDKLNFILICSSLKDI